MGLGELAIIAVVAVLVLGPKQAQQLSQQCAKFWRQLQSFKQTTQKTWDTALKHQQLADNEQRAQQASTKNS